jgi:hypothetical protein
MTIPNLINPVLVSIQPFRRKESLVDPDYQHPVQAATRELTYRCNGQVKWSMDEQTRAGLSGAELGSMGYIVFRLFDLRTVGLSDGIQVKDRITMMGAPPSGIKTDVYVTGLRYEGHYPDVNGPTLVKAFFSAERPAKGEPNFG